MPRRLYERILFPVSRRSMWPSPRTEDCWSHFYQNTPTPSLYHTLSLLRSMIYWCTVCDRSVIDTYLSVRFLIYFPSNDDVPHKSQPNIIQLKRFLFILNYVHTASISHNDNNIIPISYIFSGLMPCPEH